MMYFEHKYTIVYVCACMCKHAWVCMCACLHARVHARVPYATASELARADQLHQGLAKRTEEVQ